MAGIIARLLPEGNAAQQAAVARAYSLSTLNPNNQNMMLFADALPCLDALKQKGYWLAVATGKGRSGLDGAIAQTGTAHYWLPPAAPANARRNLRPIWCWNYATN